MTGLTNNEWMSIKLPARCFIEHVLGLNIVDSDVSSAVVLRKEIAYYWDMVLNIKFPQFKEPFAG